MGRHASGAVHWWALATRHLGREARDAKADPHHREGRRRASILPVQRSITSRSITGSSSSWAALIFSSNELEKTKRSRACFWRHFNTSSQANFFAQGTKGRDWSYLSHFSHNLTETS